MRVIAGKYRSRPLRSLRGMDIRPTADRLRETLFNVLTAGRPQALESTIWIDLYAGTGAVGIEALSRGAAKVYFVESSKEAADLIRKNLRSLGIEDGFGVLQCNTARALQKFAAQGLCADYVFLDPPYRMEDAYAETLQALSQSPILEPSGVVIAEHHTKFDPGDAFGGVTRYRKLVQGDAVLSFFRSS